MNRLNCISITFRDSSDVSRQRTNRTFSNLILGISLIAVFSPSLFTSNWWPSDTPVTMKEGEHSQIYRNRYLHYHSLQVKNGCKVWDIILFTIWVKAKTFNLNFNFIFCLALEFFIIFIGIYRLIMNNRTILQSIERAVYQITQLCFKSKIYHMQMKNIW